MKHVDRSELYPLLHALLRQRKGEMAIPVVEGNEELEAFARQVPEDRFATPPLAEDRLTPERIEQIFRHAQQCVDCQLLVFEDGLAAPRRRSQEEIDAEARSAEEEERLLRRRFFISLGYGVPAFFGAQASIIAYRNLKSETVQDSGPALRSNEPTGFQLHPLQMLFLLLLVIAAFGLAEAIRIANELWLDWTRAKEAVPVIGKKWAERSRRKRREARKDRP